MAWKEGPLPPGTYQWGGVCLIDQKRYEDGSYGFFYMASFDGDHADVYDGVSDKPRRVEAEDIAIYDNSLEWPFKVSPKS